MPLKLAALPLVDDLEPLAMRVGAVNTVVPRDGGLFGANTDVPGLVAALIEAGLTSVRPPGGARGRRIRPGRGRRAGRAGCAVGPGGRAQCPPGRGSDGRGPGQWDRSLDRRLGPRADGGYRPRRERRAGDGGGVARPWIRPWPAAAPLFDLVYAPWPTPLAVAAARAGARVLGGLDLLVHQAVGQVALMTGREVDVSVLRAAGEAALPTR